MFETAVIMSAVWLLGIGVFEAIRPKGGYPFDFLSIANLLFALNYAVPPLGYSLSKSYDEQMARFFPYDGFDPYSPNTLYATLIAIAAHVVIVAIYLLSKHHFFAKTAVHGLFPRLTRRLGEKRLYFVTLTLGLLGGTTFVLYLISLDGLLRMIQLSQPLSTGEATATYGFLKIIAMLVVPAFHVSLSQALERKAFSRTLWGLLAGAFALTSALLLVHDLGRLQIAMFVLIPVVAWGTVRGKGFILHFPLIAAAGWFLLMVFKPTFSYLTRGGDEYLSKLVDALIAPFLEMHIILASLFAEFSFPYYVLEKYLSLIPDSVPFRGGEDFIAAAILLLPSVLVGKDPDYILGLNLELFQQPLPIDLLSLGYVSFGFGGIFLFAVGYSLVLAACEAAFADTKGWLSALFRVAWMFYVPWWLMYADPMNAVKRGFGLIVATALLFLFSARARPRSVAAQAVQ